MGEFSIWHWLIVLAIVVMVFGTKKLKTIGADLGQAVKGFKEGIREAEASTPPPNVAPEAAADAAPHRLLASEGISDVDHVANAGLKGQP